MKQYAYLYIIAAALAVACQNEGSDEQREYTGYTMSGSPYIHFRSNSGPKPQVGDVVYFQVLQHAENGLNIDSRKNQRAPTMYIPPDSLIDINNRPIVEGLKLMSVGDSLRISFNLNELPSKPPIFANVDILNFDLVLLEILSQEVHEQRLAEEEREYIAKIEGKRARAGEIEQLCTELTPELVTGVTERDVITLPRSLKYIMLERGNGPEIVPGSRIFVNHCGVLETGKVFDNSFRDGRPFVFTYKRGEVILGWDLIFDQFREGDRAIMYVPYQLAYGVAGDPPKIPERANLVFYIEVEEVR
jgi:FKBP-type peptidyl-prolyl cis-trans isomerase